MPECSGEGTTQLIEGRSASSSKMVLRQILLLVSPSVDSIACSLLWQSIAWLYCHEHPEIHTGILKEFYITWFRLRHNCAIYS